MSPQGNLWLQVREATGRALACGALTPIPTRPLTMADGGLVFLVRIVANLVRKASAPSPGNAASRDPFLPYEPELFVADLSATHVALLNKFNVLEQHALLVTREFEDQELPLTRLDLDAAWLALAAGPSLVFYNAGAGAGASQPHRHLQAVPCPLTEAVPDVPIEAAFDDSEAGRWSAGTDGEVVTSPRLPFRHVFGWFEPGLHLDPGRAGGVTLRLYRALLHSCGLLPDTSGKLGPYNLLLTRRWMLLVPRAREHFGPISINALGFAGALLVRNEVELELVRQTGPLAILAAVARS